MAVMPDIIPDRLRAERCRAHSGRRDDRNYQRGIECWHCHTGLEFSPGRHCDIPEPGRRYAGSERLVDRDYRICGAVSFDAGEVN